MFRTRFLCLLLCVGCVLALVGGASAAEVACDDVYCFQTVDFSDQEGLSGICITGLPDSSAGTVMLGSRVLRCGDILTAQQVTQMTFQPLLTEDDKAAQVTYLPIYPDRVEPAAVMTISIRGKEDKAPVAEDMALETYKNLPNEGKLKVSDPEGKPLTYTVTRQPKRGTLSLREDGTFTYTPKKNKVGTDSFTFTAADPAGKVSREATVTVEILKPTDAKQYTDTLGSQCRFTAEWMKNTGLFVGEKVGGTHCFQPEKAVSRGEFLTMLVKVLELPQEETTLTGFEDTAPDWLKPYLAAALRAGITADWPDGTQFCAGQDITGAEAALLVQNALDLPVSTVNVGKDEEGDQPVWALTAMTAVAEQGMRVPTGTLSRGEAAQLLYQISRMLRSGK